MKKQIIDERAKWLVDHEVLTLANSLVERALSSGGEWECAGYSYDNIINVYDEENDTYRDVFQWFLVTDYLANLIEENGGIILNTEDGYYWGRTGYGYALEDDFLEIAEKIEKELGHI